MAVVRGFVQKIDIGRAGLVQVTLVHEDARTGVYIIRDLDADPERFNERLSKLGVLRDAMNRAEPVEIEHQNVEGGNEIERAVRITRDDLAPATGSDSFSGLVVQVTITATQGILAGGLEQVDQATVVFLHPASGSRTAVLNLQTPERAAAAEMLRVLLDAEAKTGPVTVRVEPRANRILAVTAGRLLSHTR